ncbi:MULTISPECIES: hypothetical protein [Salinibaculum]|uniref:hypothetical protein n=1 Tax=Salinibaculum TaxID=2732368 RepID=UPI0030CB7EB3
MINNTIRLTVFAVVLTVALSMVAAPAVAAPGDKVTVTDPDQMDKHEKKGVMPGDNVQFPDSFFDEKIGPGNSVANDAAPEDRFLKAKKAFDEKVTFPDSFFDGNDDEEFQDGSDPALSP